MIAMPKLGFILDGMTYLKYYVPLVEEANARGFHSTFLISRSYKYNCPYVSNHQQILKNICDIYNIDLQVLDEKITKKLDIIFTVEGTKIQHIEKSKIFSLCYSTDFTLSYESYIDNVKYAIMSSKFIANYYGKTKSNNLYLGTPKFDVKLDDAIIRNKYNLDNDKYVTIFYPRLRDISSAPLRKITEDLNRLGYKSILKTRLKDPIAEADCRLSKFNFADASWHPHTSLELIQISDFVINFSSSVIEETTALQTPLINFHIKPFKKPFEFLYESSFVQNIDTNYSLPEFKNAVDRLTTLDFSNDFFEANKKMFDTKVSSKDIIDKIT